VTLTAAELELGAAAPPRTIGPLTAADFVRYSGASGDFNPMHWDVETAQRAGFTTLFAQGMFSAGVLASFAADWLGQECLRSVSVRFLEIVPLGDTLTCAARVGALDDIADGRRAEVELECTLRSGAPAIRGSATFVVPFTG
jgi:acyl dehydratase